MVGYYPNCGNEIEETDKLCKNCRKDLLKWLDIQSNRLNGHGNKIWE